MLSRYPFRYRSAPEAAAEDQTGRGAGRRVRPTGPARVTLVAWGAGLCLLVGTSARLAPDQRGYGTHEQLGLPPCTFRVVFGIACPSCGMTTSWSYLVRGQLGAAFGTHAAGVILGMLALVGGPWAVGSGLLGRWLLGRPRPVLVLGGLTILVAAALAHWAVRVGGG